MPVPTTASARTAGPSGGSVAPGRQAKRLDESLRAALAGCARDADRPLTRGEIALIFEVSSRTVDRWEQKYALPTERKNARVLRYQIEAVVILCSLGIRMSREAAMAAGLVPDAILALADKHSRCNGTTARADIRTLNPVLVATTEDECRLLRLWGDPKKREGLIVVIRAMCA